jgi:hypothetical protein
MTGCEVVRGVVGRQRYPRTVVCRNRASAGIGVAAGWATAVMLAVTVVAVVAMIYDGRSSRSCAEQRRDDEATVRTMPWQDADELPDLGAYLEIHWQAHALGNPCSRMPGPTDWIYQGIIRLRPEDASTLAVRYAWQPVTATASPASPGPLVWPALAPFVTADVHWSRSDAYDLVPPQSRWRQAYLDADRALLLFTLNDH